MRIEPEQQIAARTRQPETPRGTDRGFASTLAAARDASTTNNAATIDPTRPAAEQWGQYGQGATTAGFGPPPDPAQFAHHPTGADTAAHPLNARGNTTANPAFTVPGYTVRGTPIPPGFYNLAYYNQYLAEGGTPLEGFAAYDPANGSLTDVYGQFGDGQDRATSFATGLVTRGEQPAPGAATIVTLASSASSPAAPAAVESARAPEAAPVVAETNTSRAADPAPVAPTVTASAPVAPAQAQPATLLANAAHQAVRLALQNLLDDLLKIA